MVFRSLAYRRELASADGWMDGWMLELVLNEVQRIVALREKGNDV